MDTVSGAYAQTVTDLSLKAPGYPLAISRSYSSADTSSGPLGPGWSLPWEADLSIDSSTGNATFTAEDGDRYLYTSDGAGGFSPPFGVRSVLAEVTNSSGEVTGYTLTDPSGHVVLTFSVAGLLESENDATGRGLTFTYNSSGQVSSITDAAGHEVTLSYNGSLLAQVALPDSQAVTYGYNSSGQLTSVTDPGNEKWQYTYSSAGLLATVEDPDQQVTVQNTYNSSGQVTGQEDGDTNDTHFSYTTTGGGLSETDVTAPDGGITTYLYGGGLLLEEIGPVDDAATEYDYNVYAQSDAITDPLHRLTYYEYDGDGDLTSETSDLGHQQDWTYDGSGNVLTYENADSQTTTYTYNSMDEVLTEETPGTQETRYTYNGDGSLASEVSARGYTTTYAYFSDGMLESVTNPDSGSTSYTYDSMGYPLTITDPMTRAATYEYDTAERVASVTTPAGETKYGYDADGNLTSREDPDQHTWIYGYNADSELTKATDPLGTSDSYGYDGDGDQTSFTDGRGIVTTTTYYLDDLPKAITYSDGTPSVSYLYDADGETTSVTDGTGTRALSYNGDGELTAEGGFSYGYDDAGNITSRTYPDSTATGYAYNSDGQVSSMTVGSAKTTYSYNADGDLVSTVEPDGVTESRTYDNANQLTAVADATSSSTLDSYGLTLNADGQPTSIAVTQNASAQPARYYGYDSSGRLTSECYSSSGQASCSAASAGTASGSAADAAVPAGLVTSGETGLCADDANDSGTAGNKVQVWKCLADTAQTWTAADDGTVQVAGGCLAAAGTSSGSVAELEPCTAHDAAEQWRAGANWELVNSASGLCLTDPSASTTNGTQLQVTACTQATDQEWRLPGNSGGWLTDGVTGECADDTGGSTTAGAEVVIDTCDGSTGQQKWGFDPDGTVRINSLCAEPANAGTAQSTGIVLETCVTGSTAQEWAVGPDWWVFNINAAMCLSDPNASTTAGTQLVITPCTGNTQQSWRVPPARNNAGELANEVSGECADADGTEGVIWSCTSSSTAQDWKVTGGATIVSSTGQCLEPSGGGTATGTKVVVTTCSGAEATWWAEGPGTDAWITNVNSGLCLADTNASTTNGTQLNIATCSGTTQQHWILPVTSVTWTPTGVSATAGPDSATVSWAPESGGGNTITGYTVTSSGGQTATAGPDTASATVTGLTPGTAYTFTVTVNTSNPAAATTTPATAAITPGNETTYSYDAAGNITSSRTDGVTTTSTYNTDEELTSSVTGSTTTSYSYDPDGDQTSAGDTSYAYNAVNEMTGADTATGNFTYSYDSAGALATTSLNGTKLSSTVWDLNDPLPELAEETTPAGSATGDYAWNPDGTLNSETQGGPAGTGTAYGAVTDWEGSVTGLVSTSGTQVSSTTYTAYGTPGTTGTVTSDIGYTGSYTLTGAGLDDMRARDYSPAASDFTSVDPELEQTGQPYAYAGGSPVSATDPSGDMADPNTWRITIEDIIEYPEILNGMNPGQLMAALGGIPAGYTVTPGKGSSIAAGWSLRGGGDVRITWMKGSARSDHPDTPYWRVATGLTGKSERIPAGEWPDGPAEYTQLPGSGDGTSCEAAYTGFSCMPDNPLFGDEGDEDGPVIGDDPFTLAYILAGLGC